jgi:hypothetical protein
MDSYPWNQRIYEESKKKKFFKKLNEFYIKYNFDWVENFINDLYYSSLSAEELFNKYQISYDFEYSDENRLVLKSSYIPQSNSYNITLNKKFLSGNNSEEYYDDLIKELQHTLVHEDTHRQQNQFELKAKNPDKVPTKEYLSEPIEIDARAREIASWLKNSGCNLEQAIEKVQFNKDTDKFEETIKNYHEIGGSVYHKFLSEIYRYYDGED